MSEGNTNTGQQLPEPNPTLESSDGLIGTWGRSDPSEAVDGRATSEWVEGGFFLLQRVDFAGAKGIEVTGYDGESGSLRWRYLDNGGGIPNVHMRGGRGHRYDLDSHAAR